MEKTETKEYVSTTEIQNWIFEQEHNPAVHESPAEAITCAVMFVESVAYAKGLRDGLDRLERVASLFPTKKTTGKEVLDMACRELKIALKNWEESVGIHRESKDFR